MPSEIKTLIKTSKKKTRKKLFNLSINIPEEPEKNEESGALLTPKERCTTPELEKYLCFNNGFFKSGGVFKARENNLTNGANGIVKPVTLFIDNGKKYYDLVEKSKVTIREIKLLLTIKQAKDKLKREEKSPFDFIQTIVYPKEDRLFPTYYSRYERGGDLKKHQNYIHEQYKLKNEMVLSYLFYIMRQLLQALDTLENLGIVHNDLKPDNIFIREKGDIVVADFGCAYFADQTAPQFGTLNYSDAMLFLEEFCHKPLKDASKCDVWSLGLTFEFLIQGKLPNRITSEGYIIPNELPDILATQLRLKNWASAYKDSRQCAKARKAKNYLENLEKNASTAVGSIIQVEILKNLTLVMQLPVDERPCSKELIACSDRFASYFGTRKACEEKSKIFSSQLIKNIEKSEIKETETIASANKSVCLRR